MFDEVYRLQGLLARLARLHAVLRRWVRRAGPNERVLTTASLAAWQALRGVSGLLAAQPNDSFHPPPIRRPRLPIRLRAVAISLVRNRTATRLRWLTEELDGLRRMVADIEAVSRAPAVFETCTRIRAQFKILVETARSEDREFALRRQREQKVRAATAADFRATAAVVETRQSRPSILSSSESI